MLLTVEGTIILHRNAIIWSWICLFGGRVGGQIVKKQRMNG